MLSLLSLFTRQRRTSHPGRNRRPMAPGRSFRPKVDWLEDRSVPSVLAGTQAGALGPVTSLHYAPNHNFFPADAGNQDNFNPNGEYQPAKVGFNLADVTGVRPEAVSRVNSLTGDVKALVWVGLDVPSDDLTFQAIVKQFKVNDKVYGFYLYDSPSLTLDDDPNAVKLSIPPHEERLQ